MKTAVAVLAIAMLALMAVGAEAQTLLRVRGTITAFDGSVLSVKTRDGKDIQVQLAEKAAVATVKAVSLADIKPGDGVGATTRPGPDGSLTALEVHVFPASMAVPNEGHRPWDLEPGSMMTNGNVAAAVGAAGAKEITIEYKGGSQKVKVPDNVPIVTTVPAERSLLAPGAYIVTTARAGTDGVLFTQRIAVSKDGVAPAN